MEKTVTQLRKSEVKGFVENIWFMASIRPHFEKWYDPDIKVGETYRFGRIDRDYDFGTEEMIAHIVKVNDDGSATVTESTKEGEMHWNRFLPTREKYERRWSETDLELFIESIEV